MAIFTLEKTSKKREMPLKAFPFCTLTNLLLSILCPVERKVVVTKIERPP